MIEQFKKMATSSDKKVVEFLLDLERETFKLEVGDDPTLYHAYLVNTSLMALATALECEIRRIPVSSLVGAPRSEEEKQEIDRSFKETARLLSEFYFQEITSKRRPGSVQVVVDPPSTGKES